MLPLQAYVTRDLAERLDGSYHNPLVEVSLNRLREGRYPLVRLDTLAPTISQPPRYKRIYVPAEHGLPFLTPSMFTQLYPTESKFISPASIAPEAYQVPVGHVLVTRSGSVGRCILVSERLSRYAITDDALRLDCGSIEQNGYITAFLMSPYGQSQVTREVYGGVVDHINESHLAAVLIPEAPEAVQMKIGSQVVRAFTLKDEATALEEDAIQQLEKQLEQRAHLHRETSVS
jgi:type I restriction enzyme, S subunit